MATQTLSEDQIFQLFFTLDSASKINNNSSNDGFTENFFSSNTVLGEVMNIYLVFLTPEPPSKFSGSILSPIDQKIRYLLENPKFWLYRVLSALTYDTRNVATIALEIVERLVSIKKLPFKFCEELIKCFGLKKVNEETLISKFESFFTQFWAVETISLAFNCTNVSFINKESISTNGFGQYQDSSHKSSEASKSFKRLRFINPAAAKTAMVVWKAVMGLFTCNAESPTSKEAGMGDTNFLFFKWPWWKTWLNFFLQHFQATNSLYCYYQNPEFSAEQNQNSELPNFGIYNDSEYPDEQYLLSDTTRITIIKEGLYQYNRLAIIVAQSCSSTPFLSSSQHQDLQNPNKNDSSFFYDILEPNNIAYSPYYSNCALVVLEPFKYLLPPPSVPSRFLQKNNFEAFRKQVNQINQFRSVIFKSFYFSIICLRISGVVASTGFEKNWISIWDNVILSFFEKCFKNYVPVDELLSGLNSLITGKIHNGRARYFDIQKALLKTCEPEKDTKEAMNSCLAFDRKYFQTVNSEFVTKTVNDSRARDQIKTLYDIFYSDHGIFKTSMEDICYLVSRDYEQEVPYEFSTQPTDGWEQDILPADIVGLALIMQRVYEDENVNPTMSSGSFDRRMFLNDRFVLSSTCRDTCLNIFGTFAVIPHSVATETFSGIFDIIRDLCTVCTTFYITEPNNLAVFNALKDFCIVSFGQDPTQMDGKVHLIEKTYTPVFTNIWSMPISLNINTLQLSDYDPTAPNQFTEDEFCFPFNVALFLVLFKLANTKRLTAGADSDSKMGKAYLNKFSKLSSLTNGTSSKQAPTIQGSSKKSQNKGLIGNYGSTSSDSTSEAEVSVSSNNKNFTKSDDSHNLFFLNMLKHCILPAVTDFDLKEFLNNSETPKKDDSLSLRLYNSLIKVLTLIPFPSSFPTVDLWNMIWSANIKSNSQLDIKKITKHVISEKASHDFVYEEVCMRYGSMLHLFSYLILLQEADDVKVYNKMYPASHTKEPLGPATLYDYSYFSYLILVEYMDELVVYGILPKVIVENKNLTFGTDAVSMLLSLAKLLKHSQIFPVFSKAVELPILNNAENSKLFSIAQQTVAFFIVIEHMLSETESVTKDKSGAGLFDHLTLSNSDLNDLKRLFELHMFAMKFFCDCPIPVMLAFDNWLKDVHFKVLLYIGNQEEKNLCLAKTNHNGGGFCLPFSADFPAFSVPENFACKAVQTGAYYIGSFLARFFSTSQISIDTASPTSSIHAGKLFPSKYMLTLVDFILTMLENTHSDQPENDFENFQCTKSTLLSLFVQVTCVVVRSRVLEFCGRNWEPENAENINDFANFLFAQKDLVHEKFGERRLSFSNADLNVNQSENEIDVNTNTYTLAAKKMLPFWFDDKENDINIVIEALRAGLASRNDVLHFAAAHAIERIYLFYFRFLDPLATSDSSLCFESFKTNPKARTQFFESLPFSIFLHLYKTLPFSANEPYSKLYLLNILGENDFCTETQQSDFMDRFYKDVMKRAEKSIDDTPESLVARAYADVNQEMKNWFPYSPLFDVFPEMKARFPEYSSTLFKAKHSKTHTPGINLVLQKLAQIHKHLPVNDSDISSLSPKPNDFENFLLEKTTIEQEVFGKRVLKSKTNSNDHNITTAKITEVNGAGNLINISTKSQEEATQVLQPGGPEATVVIENDRSMNNGDGNNKPLSKRSLDLNNVMSIDNSLLSDSRVSSSGSSTQDSEESETVEILDSSKLFDLNGSSAPTQPTETATITSQTPPSSLKRKPNDQGIATDTKLIDLDKEDIVGIGVDDYSFNSGSNKSTETENVEVPKTINENTTPNGSTVVNNSQTINNGFTIPQFLDTQSSTISSIGTLSGIGSKCNTTYINGAHEESVFDKSELSYIEETLRGVHSQIKQLEEFRKFLEEKRDALKKTEIAEKEKLDKQNIQQETERILVGGEDEILTLDGVAETEQMSGSNNNVLERRSARVSKRRKTTL